MWCYYVQYQWGISVVGSSIEQDSGISPGTGITELIGGISPGN